MRSHRFGPSSPLVLISIALLSLGVASSPARAAELGLAMVADGDSRWFDLFSDAFSQADGGPLFPGAPGADGFYLASALPAFVTQGGGATVFPFGVDFGVAGSVTVDDAGLTGVGVELAPVTALSIDFATFIADDDAVVSAPYVTTISGVSGSVTYEDGVPTQVDLTSTVTFTYDFTAFPGGAFLDFVGSFDIVAGSFALDVSQPTYPSQFGTIAFIWDVTGAATAIAPPSQVPALGGLGVAAIAGLVALGGFARARSARLRA